MLKKVDYVPVLSTGISGIVFKSVTFGPLLKRDGVILDK